MARIQDFLVRMKEGKSDSKVLGSKIPGPVFGFDTFRLWGVIKGGFKPFENIYPSPKTSKPS